MRSTKGRKRRPEKKYEARTPDRTQYTRGTRRLAGSLAAQRGVYHGNEITESATKDGRESKRKAKKASKEKTEKEKTKSQNEKEGGNGERQSGNEKRRKKGKK